MDTRNICSGAIPRRRGEYLATCRSVQPGATRPTGGQGGHRGAPSRTLPRPTYVLRPTSHVPTYDHIGHPPVFSGYTSLFLVRFPPDETLFLLWRKGPWWARSGGRARRAQHSTVGSQHKFEVGKIDYIHVCGGFGAGGLTYVYLHRFVCPLTWRPGCR